MKRAVMLVVLSGLVSPGAPPIDASSDWPQWRGVDRDAVSAETGLLDRWPEDGPPVVWRVDVGAGFSSVTIAEGRVYTLWDEDGRQFLVCLDALTGKERWRHELGAAFDHHYGNGPRSTPLVDDGVVFAIGTGGRLVAADAKTGELRWRHDLVGEFRAALPSYGYSSSPLVVGDRLLVEAGSERGSYMAFATTGGELVWAVDDDRPAYTSPIRISIDGVEQVVFWSAHGLRAVSPVDGAPLWQFAAENFCPVSGDPLNTATPIFIAPDRLFVSSGAGAAVIRISRDGDSFGVETVWRSEEMRNDVNTSLLVGHHIYGFDRGTLKCLDARTGRLKWKARGFQRGSLIAAEGKLIVLGEAGNLALVEANPAGYVVRSEIQVLDGKNWTAPSLADGRLYLRNHDELVCLDLRDERGRRR